MPVVTMRNLAVGLAVGICVLVLISSDNPAWSSFASGTLFLICGIGLASEARKILLAGEVTSRIYMSTQDMVVVREATPVKFFSYVITFSLLGLFCMLYSALSFFMLVRQM
jgi:hypothetical protein